MAIHYEMIANGDPYEMIAVGDPYPYEMIAVGDQNSIHETVVARDHNYSCVRWSVTNYLVVSNEANLLVDDKLYLRVGHEANLVVLS